MNEKRARDIQIANTILQQLGGSRFVAMTGAYNLSADINCLILRFKGSNKWNGLRVTLNGLDLYDVKFVKVGRAPEYKITTKEINGLYNDQLQEIFTRETGLYTSL